MITELPPDERDVQPLYCRHALCRKPHGYLYPGGVLEIRSQHGDKKPHIYRGTLDELAAKQGFRLVPIDDGPPPPAG